MKNFLNFYYNLNAHNIFFRFSKYFFKCDNGNYMLLVCDRYNIDDYYIELSNQLKTYNYFFSIVPNKDGNLISIIENKPYVLLKISNIINSQLSIFDIRNDLFIKYSDKLTLLNHFPWINLWENKIDYLEEIFNSKKERYRNIYPLFSFFVGLSENALLYFKETLKEEKMEECDNLTFQHDRLNINSELYDYYNPLNIIIDHPCRDISEYIKSSFVDRVWDIDVFVDFLNSHYFSVYGIRIMYARILFPSFFFDYLEKIFREEKDVDLSSLELVAYDYQFFLKQITNLFSARYNIPVINWIIKKT